MFYEKEEKPKEKVVPPRKNVQAVTSVAIQPINVTYPGSMNSAEYQAFREQFMRILDDENKRNYPGNDYYEFVVMKNAMNAIPQETLRYQAAFAGWSTGGNQTKKSLLETAQVYLGLVEKEIKDFESAYQQQYSQQVTKNEQIIDQKTKEIQSLVERMNLLNAEVNQLKQENTANTASLTVKHDAFMAAGEAQKREILDEMDKINHYIT